jgi:molybdopterin-guanine dinucleotide biosynthesis protein A
MPSLPLNLVASMVKTASSTRLVVIRAEGEHQLVFLLHRELLDSIKHYLDGNQHSVMQWLDTVEHQSLDMAVNNGFLNINKPEQLRL